MPVSPIRASKSHAGRLVPTIAEASRLNTDALFSRLEASPQGLTRREAAARLVRFGENAVASERRIAPMHRLLQLFASPLSGLLLVLAVVSALTGEARGAAAIAAMVVLSVLLSWYQEYRSGDAAERLRALVHTTATVMRRDRRDAPSALPGGKLVEIPLHRLVPGDIVHLGAGDIVPADVCLLSAKDLFVDQSALTGESLPAEKSAVAENAGPRPVLELRNVGFMGTHVVSGTASAVVVATGARTQFGSVAAETVGARQPTSFDLGIDRFIGLILRIMVVMVPLVFLINGLSKGNWVEAFLFAVAVAVGLTPEMLPMVITVSLAKGALAMSRKKVIVKRLNSIQNLGAMDVLCTDKTGTLTQNKVILERHVDIFGEESRHVLELAYLNSRYQSGMRNLLDVAILEQSELREHVEAIASRYSKVDEVPFDFERRRMSVLLASEGSSHLLVCKGAVEEILAVCSGVEERGRIVPITPGHREELLPVIRGLNEQGFRVMAVAYKKIPASQTVCSGADESGLVLAGYIAFLDPPKESAGAAVRALQRQGVQVKVLTGDNEAVTRKVCSMVGIDPGGIVLGSELQALSDAALAEAVEHGTVFAKLAPQQKARIVAALHSRGHVVGFLGDGINDGPALKAADVGVSVNTATDIAKESADIILLEKNLLVLRDGVVEGRRVFGNITKYLRMGTSSSFGNMLSVVGASAFLPFLPMAPVQILLNNLLYDVSQTALPTDNVDPQFVERPRKWDIASAGRYILAFGPVSSLFDYVTFFVMLQAFDARANPALFQTGWFVESILSQTLVVYVIRTAKIPFLESRPSATLLVTSAAICTTGAWLPYSGLAQYFGFTPPPAGYWAAVAAIVFCYLLLTQLVKTLLVRRFGLG
jgi:P-type Mg2+ transporter